MGSARASEDIGASQKRRRGRCLETRQAFAVAQRRAEHHGTAQRARSGF